MFTTSLKALNTNLLFLKRAAGYTARSGNGIAALNVLRLSVADGILSVTFYDYATAVTVRQAVSSPLDVLVETLVPVTAFVDAVKSAGKGTGTFTVNGDTLTIAGDDMTTSVAISDLESDAPPALPAEVESADGENWSDNVHIVTTGAELAESTATVLPAIGKDDTLPMLTGVYVQMQDNEVTLASTDRFKLCTRTVETSNIVPDTKAVLLKGIPLTTFGKHVGKDESVSVTVGKHRVTPSWSGDRFVTLESESATVILREIDCEFPKFARLFPSRESQVVSFTVDPLALAKRLKALPKDATRAVIVVGESTVEIVGDKARDDDGAHLARFTVDATELETDGLGFTAGFNTGYLASMLAVAPKGVKARLAFTTANRPMTIEWTRSKSLIMPLRLADGRSGTYSKA